MFTFIIIGILIVLDIIVFIILTRDNTSPSRIMFYFLKMLFTNAILMTLGLVIEEFKKEKLKDPVKYEEVTETFYRKIE